MRHYIMCHRNRFARMQRRIQHHWIRADEPSDSDVDDAQHDGQSRSHRKLAETADRFFGLWNGGLWGESIVHYQPATCSRSREDIAAAMAKAAREYLFQAIPCVPAHNKWTKLAPCVDGIAMALLAHGLLKKLFANLTGPTEGLQPGEDMSGWDENLRKDVSFAAVNGKRYKARALLSLS